MTIRIPGTFKSALLVAALASLLVSAGQAWAGQLTLSTNYAFGTPANNLTPWGGSPDTGYFMVENTGTTTFIGMVGQIAVSPGGDFTFGPVPVTLAPGAFVTLTVGPESSNVGGFNGTNPDGTNVGAILDVTGLLGDCPVDLSYNDSQFHSGVFRTNPFGVTLDNYVIQGGDPFGRDTSDAYETTQAPGVIVFDCADVIVPEPASLTLLGVGGLALAISRRRRKSA